MELNPGTVSIILPAYNEADRLGATLDALIHCRMCDEIVVVDDGSTDETAKVAAERDVRVIRRPSNHGKGAAMNAGLMGARGEYIVFLDSDLGETASCAGPIIDAVKNGDADLAIGSFSTPGGGFGIVLKFTRWGVRKMCGYEARTPLSGQRAMRRAVLEAVYPFREDFGVETAMLIDAVRAGFKVAEVPVSLSHRPTGRTLKGFYHRAMQGLDIARALGAAFIKYKILRKKLPPAIPRQEL
ncbi:MAG: glycosyltransferase family 2 protein [bacterium]